MELIADILLIAGAASAAFYCIVLARRLNRFTNLEQGVGGAIATLSAQVDDMTRTLTDAQGSARGSTATLADLTARAEDVARRLELLVAAMHDLPEAEPGQAKDGARTAANRDGGAAGFASARGTPKANGADSLFRSQRSWVREAAE